MSVKLAARLAATTRFIGARQAEPERVCLPSRDYRQPLARAGRQVGMSSLIGVKPQAPPVVQPQVRRTHLPVTLASFRERLRGFAGPPTLGPTHAAPALGLQRSALPSPCARDGGASTKTATAQGESTAADGGPLAVDDERGDGVRKQHTMSDDQCEDVRMDALSRHLTAEQPHAFSARDSSAGAARAHPAADVQQLAAELLEKLAYGTHLGRPMVRMVVSTGRLAGAGLTLTQDGKHVAMQIDGASPEAERDLRDRVGRSLAGKGIDFE